MNQEQNYGFWDGHIYGFWDGHIYFPLYLTCKTWIVCTAVSVLLTKLTIISRCTLARHDCKQLFWGTTEVTCSWILQTEPRLEINKPCLLQLLQLRLLGKQYFYICLFFFHTHKSRDFHTLFLSSFKLKDVVIRLPVVQAPGLRPLLI